MSNQPARDIQAAYQSLRNVLADWGHDPLFVTITGVDLYGFPSPDSDYDLRGAIVLSAGIGQRRRKRRSTIFRIAEANGLEVDLVLHDIAKLRDMLAQGNASILEEIHSPLVLLGQDVLAQLRELSAGCLTRRAYFHYEGFARSQFRKLEAQEQKLAKTLLYVYRILMTGIHALETGTLESNLPRLNEVFRFAFIPDLIAAKVHELSPLPDLDWEFHQRKIEGLRACLREAYRASRLPSSPQNLKALKAYLDELASASGRKS